eukprot:CAMPEP_0197544718 /NCGR_PEP_ID=MMETSP1320-20131121/5_1 /TAXON_ID=91990 /ORGANISM="Bolidomonas sp., Strain RCC2347" /LENGTH=77 /DNA_ID=CAMNT_0043104135 /DNA_START=57 /DNA_END=286 /DNA_ORIENTATION=-
MIRLLALCLVCAVASGLKLVPSASKAQTMNRKAFISGAGAAAIALFTPGAANAGLSNPAAESWRTKPGGKRGQQFIP